MIYPSEAEKDQIRGQAGAVPLPYVPSAVLSEYAAMGWDFMDEDELSGNILMVEPATPTSKAFARGDWDAWLGDVAEEDAPLPTVEMFGEEDTGEIRNDSLYPVQRHSTYVACECFDCEARAATRRELTKTKSNEDFFSWLVRSNG